MAAYKPQESHLTRPEAIHFDFRTKIQRKFAILTLFYKIICFGYNFLTYVIFSNPLSQAIHILPALCRDSHIDHIYGHINPYENGLT